MEWTKAQFSQVTDSYSRGRPLECPGCTAPINVEKAPGREKSTTLVTFSCGGCGRVGRATFMTIGPADFIHPPFIACPECGESEFGMLMIASDRYTRRCRKCLASRHYPLPKLHKKVIFLDQMAISNMMFALNPATDQFRQGRVDPFWMTLFERLDALVKLQLIICPDAPAHQRESLVAAHFEPLRRMYEHLSGGTGFQHDETIVRFQVQRQAREWLRGKPAVEPRLSLHEVVHGDTNAWLDHLQISVRGFADEQTIENLRTARDEIHSDILTLFGRWQAEKNLRFEDWFEREVMAFGRVTVRAYNDFIGKRAEVLSGARAPAHADFNIPPSVVLVHAIQRDFEQGGISEEEAWKKAREYLLSEALKDVPAIKISAMLWAALARKAAAGMKKPPTSGVVNDVNTISSVLPYCDALFVDNEMRGYLREGPLSTDLDYGARIFSASNRDEFLTYLDQIRTSAAPEHVAMAEDVYGKDVAVPYSTMYIQNDDTRPA